MISNNLNKKNEIIYAIKILFYFIEFNFMNKNLIKYFNTSF